MQKKANFDDFFEIQLERLEDRDGAEDLLDPNPLVLEQLHVLVDVIQENLALQKRNDVHEVLWGVWINGAHQSVQGILKVRKQKYLKLKLLIYD